MADLHIVMTGSQLDDAVDLLKATILGAEDGRTDLRARTSWPAAASNSRSAFGYHSDPNDAGSVPHGA